MKTRVKGQVARGKVAALLVVSLVVFAGLALATDWSNPHPQAGGDMAGQLLLKHELNMSDLYTGSSGKLNTLKNNSAGATAPSGPGTGQLWYDTTNQQLQIYDSTWGGGGLFSSGTVSFNGPLKSSGTNTWSGTNTFSGTTAVTGTVIFSGTTTMTGTVSFSSPFTMLSTTLVTSLNADRVDGAHALTTPTGTSIPMSNASGKIDVGWLPTSGNMYTLVTYTTSTTWTAPSGVTEIWVFGSGGGAPGGTGDVSGGGGGGEEGGKIWWHKSTVTSGATYTVTIGAGGLATGVTGTGPSGGTTSLVLSTDPTGTVVALSGGTAGGSGDVGGANGTKGALTPANDAAFRVTPDIPFWLANIAVDGVAGAAGDGGHGGGRGSGDGGIPGVGNPGASATAYSGSGGGGGGYSAGATNTGGNGAAGYMSIMYFSVIW